jgi:hypothetical protein
MAAIGMNHVAPMDSEPGSPIIRRPVCKQTSTIKLTDAIPRDPKSATCNYCRDEQPQTNKKRLVTYIQLSSDSSDDERTTERVILKPVAKHHADTLIRTPKKKAKRRRGLKAPDISMEEAERILLELKGNGTYLYPRGLDKLKGLPP